MILSKCKSLNGLKNDDGDNDDHNDDDEPILVVRTAFTDFNTMSTGLESLGIEPISSNTEYAPTSTTELSEEQTIEVLALVDKLEQDDDVQRVFHTLA